MQTTQSLVEDIQGAARLADPDLYADGIPHRLFSRLRREAPVFRAHDQDGPFWAVTSHELVQTVSNDPLLYSSARRNGGFRLFDEAKVAGILPASLMSTDPPRHSGYRRILADAFNGQRLKALRESVGRRANLLADRLLDACREGRPTDAVTDFALPLTMVTLIELIGGDPADLPRLQGWTNSLVGQDDPEYAANWEVVAFDIAAYAGELWDRGKDAPEGTFTALFRSPAAEAADLAFADFLSTLIILIVAGNETSRNSIIGGVMALAERPDQLARAAADRSLLPSLALEVIRWVTPILHMRRTATARAVLGDQAIEPGERVVMWYASANFDDKVTARPMSFDIERYRGGHVPYAAFGFGEHSCLGRILAETQIQAAVSALLDRFAAFEIAGEVTRLRSNFVTGFKTCPVVFREA